MHISSPWKHPPLSAISFEHSPLLISDPESFLTYRQAAKLLSATNLGSNMSKSALDVCLTLQTFQDLCLRAALSPRSLRCHAFRSVSLMRAVLTAWCLRVFGGAAGQVFWRGEARAAVARWHFQTRLTTLCGWVWWNLKKCLKLLEDICFFFPVSQGERDWVYLGLVSLVGIPPSWMIPKLMPHLEI